MARTLVQIKQQIKKLEKEAEDVRRKEIAGVVARIQQAIDFYELTVEDLFQPKHRKAGRPKGARLGAKRPVKTRTAPKYKDPASERTWTGHGKRPGWFVRAVEEGKKAEEMAI
ncbi:MAG: H-NS histone family protein [Planctomycetales bacterium]|nr:H-NS histone family protein [Planctomycetales bacterium]